MRKMKTRPQGQSAKMQAMCFSKLMSKLTNIEKIQVIFFLPRNHFALAQNWRCVTASGVIK